MKVRILVDVARLGLKSGAYVDIPKKDADGLILAGHADPNAAWPRETRQPRGRAPKSVDA